MPIDIALIGSLVAITKNVIDSIRGAKELAGKRAAVEVERQVHLVAESFATYRDRIGVLSAQLRQSEQLSRMLPIWLKEHSQFEVWEEIPSEEVLRKLDSGLRQFISDSVHDHFSSIFFRTSFDKLPGVPQQLAVIRQDLKALEQSLHAIPHSNLAAWRVHLPIIKVRLQDLRLKAFKLNGDCSNVQAELLDELDQAAEDRG